MAASFSPLGLNFIALNGGLLYRFPRDVLLLMSCKTWDEVDYN